MNTWIFDLQDIIFDTIQNDVEDELLGKYPDLFFTTTDINEKDPSFPTVVVREVGGVERGMTLENDGINAILYTMQVDVYSNTREQDAKRVMKSVVECLKKLQFTIIAMPEFNNTDVYRCTLRAQRMIGANDIL